MSDHDNHLQDSWPGVGFVIGCNRTATYNPEFTQVIGC